MFGPEKVGVRASTILNPVNTRTTMASLFHSSGRIRAVNRGTHAEYDEVDAETS